MSKTNLEELAEAACAKASPYERERAEQARARIGTYEREPDRTVFMAGNNGPFPRNGHETGLQFSFDQMHPSLQEILVRMDREEIAMFNQGVKLLTSLDKKTIDNFRLSLKVFSAVLFIYRGIKWSVIAFLGGLGAVSLAGDQIQKLGGWVLKLTKIFQGGS